MDEVLSLRIPVPVGDGEVLNWIFYVAYAADRALLGNGGLFACPEWCGGGSIDAAGRKPEDWLGLANIRHQPADLEG